MKEIGGYFELEHFTGKEYYDDLLDFNCARSALLYLLIEKKISKIFLPYFLCDEVYKACRKANVEVIFYNIDEAFLPVITTQLKEHELIYIVNYYGCLTNETISGLVQKYENVVIDHVQAFFQKPMENIGMIYSCRKFFGVPDGAYLYTGTAENKCTVWEYADNAMDYLIGRYEYNANLFYERFKERDAAFADSEIKRMSAVSKNILCGIDYEKVKNQRTANYRYLNQALKGENKLCVPDIEGAFAYPLYLKNGRSIRKKLIERKIYVPVLWPNVLEETPENSLEYEYATNILPLPCDQRYGADDMKYMVSIIKELIANGL